ncbi:MAG: c-type cytochrome [Paracoccaceae bacterium]
MKRLLAVFATFWPVAVCAGDGAPKGEALAAEEALLALEGDVEYGAYLSSECISCHQASGANDGIPGIVGWDEETFRYAMLDYRTKLRDHPVMNMIAGRLSDEEIAALSTYFATLENDTTN